jgi:hypothetical protein
VKQDNGRHLIIKSKINFKVLQSSSWIDKRALDDSKYLLQLLGILGQSAPVFLLFPLALYKPNRIPAPERSVATAAQCHHCSSQHKARQMLLKNYL